MYEIVKHNIIKELQARTYVDDHWYHMHCITNKMVKNTQQLTNGLSVFDHFVGWHLKRSEFFKKSSTENFIFCEVVEFSEKHEIEDKDISISAMLNTL